MPSAPTEFNHSRLLEGWLWLLRRDVRSCWPIVAIWAVLNGLLDHVLNTILDATFTNLLIGLVIAPIILVYLLLMALRSDQIEVYPDLQSAMACYPKLLLMYVISTFGILIASVFLVLPGLVLFVLWVIAAPILVAEEKSTMAALSDSYTAVKGVFFPVVGVIFSFCLGCACLFFISLPFSVALGGLPDGFLWNFVCGPIIHVSWIYLMAAIYLELRYNEARNIDALELGA